uniref:Flagellin biosynthesis protein FlgD n=1 Tax=OCS116 cluster bacterium TaxID=2030921 RepID=A0A2A4Z3Y7_9PROT
MTLKVIVYGQYHLLVFIGIGVVFYIFFAQKNTSQIEIKSMKYSTFKQSKSLAVSALLATGMVEASLATANAKTVPILVQLDNYTGEKAYFAAYLVDEKGRYQKTLWVSGNELKYFPDLPRWWKYQTRQPQELDAITGASTASGDRNIIKVEIEDEFIDAGYKLRIETAVEDHDHYPLDVEVELSTANSKQKIAGTGYVRTVIFKL